MVLPFLIHIFMRTCLHGDKFLSNPSKNRVMCCILPIHIILISYYGYSFPFLFPLIFNFAEKIKKSLHFSSFLFTVPLKKKTISYHLIKTSSMYRERSRFSQLGHTA